jgi:DNA polymerase III delta subunit
MGGLRLYEAALEKAAAELPRLAVAYGDSEFLRDWAVRRFREAWFAEYPGGDLRVIRGTGEDRQARISDLTREMGGGSLFGNRKLLLARQANRLLFPVRSEGEVADSGKGNDRERAFLERVENLPDGIWVLLETSELPKNRRLGKRLAELAFTIQCQIPYPRELPGWLRERAAGLGKTLTPPAIELLVQSRGADLGKLAGELDKLALFAGDADPIDAEMAERLLAGDGEFDLFAFGNAIENGDRRRAAALARRIAVQGIRDQRGKRESGESSAHKIMSMLAKTLSQILAAKTAAARGLDSLAFAEEEKCQPFRAEKLLAAAARLEFPVLCRMLARVSEEMRRLHDTGGDPLLCLETMAVVLTGE